MIRDHSKHIRQHENKHEIYIQFKKNIHIWFHLVLLSKWPEWSLYTQSRCITSHHIILPLRLIWTFKLKWCKWFDTKLLIHCWIHSRKSEEKKLILIDETKKQKKKQQKNLPRIPKRIILLNEMNCIRLQSEIICNTADRRRERRSSALNRSYLIYAKQLEIVYHSFPFREKRTKHNFKDSIAFHRHMLNTKKATHSGTKYTIQIYRQSILFT